MAGHGRTLVHGFRRGRDTPSHDLCDCDFGLSDLSVGLGHSSVDRVRTPKRQVGRNTLRSIVFAAGFGVHRFRSHSSVHLEREVTAAAICAKVYKL